VVTGANGASVIGANRLGKLPVGRLNDAVEQLERELIAQGLERTKGNKSRLSRELGISRSNLILKIQKYSLEKPGPSARRGRRAGGAGVSAPGASYRQSICQTDDGAPLWFEVRGEGDETPVVLCDGLGCDGFIWRYLWEPLTARRRVMHWNYRGHGKSGVAHDATRIGVEYICRDLQRLMDETELGEAVLFGHSMGVQVALEFHRRHRSRVKGLVLICGSYGTPLDTWHDQACSASLPSIKRAVESAPSWRAPWCHG